ncbi:type VI secretion system-associated protein TagO, partial [Pseudomonas putida]|uniref:type VI secretion system-associated protein TagO n=2 Tax=Pseudomonas TaxID=286 RepID=UPI00370A9B7C
MIIRYAGGVGLSLLFLLMPALTRASQDCSRIVSNIERLACFDQAAGTPGFTPHRQWSAQELE